LFTSWVFKYVKDFLFVREEVIFVKKESFEKSEKAVKNMFEAFMNKWIV